ncbi:MAG: hypothetical protein LBM98_01350 [Oscillospiraceae bacterium]|nr:hypothetical protein [Oscillospiraceae bacterium]
MRSTGKLAIRRALQVRSNPVPGGQHTECIVEVLRQPWIASPHIIGTYRKCGGGFAKTGRAKPCPVPAHRAGTVDGGRDRARRGETTPPPTAAPLPRGEFTGEGGFETRPYVYCTTRNPRPNPRHYSLFIINCQLSIVKTHSPLGRGAASAAGGAAPTSKPPSLIFDI